MLSAEDIRAIWIASVPRTGSMWTFNVARDLVRFTGRAALPEIVPHDDAEMEQLGRAGIAANDGTYVLKVHTRVAADLPHSFYVVTHRHIRDSLVSFMRFTHADFEAGLRFAAGAIRLERHFAAFPAAHTLQVAYSDIVERPEVVVEALARALGVAAGPAAIAAIVARYAKDKVQARLVAREQELREQIEAGQSVDVRAFVPMGDASLRAFDMTTGFQSGHVSAYREGDWRTILTKAQQTALDTLIADARSRGFRVEDEPPPAG
jgi:hypothetical protein